MSKTTELFNDLWLQKKITKPIAVLYGGYAGTGKSTTSKNITELINYTTYIPTGIIRSLIVDYLSKRDLALITTHTYQLHTVGKYLDPNIEANKALISDRFIEQIRVVSKAINNIISFAASEKQHLIIDGNHIFPGFIDMNPDIHIIEFYNMVGDPQQHYKMLCGPTHNRTLNNDEFQTARILHDYTVKECIKNQKNIFDYKKSFHSVHKILDEKLQQIIRESTK